MGDRLALLLVNGVLQLADSTAESGVLGQQAEVYTSGCTRDQLNLSLTAHWIDDIDRSSAHDQIQRRRLLPFVTD